MKTVMKNRKPSLQAPDTFKYRGFTFSPSRKFSPWKENFYFVAQRLGRPIALKGKYSYEGFYAALKKTIPDKADYDVFFCVETSQEVVPTTFEMRVY